MENLVFDDRELVEEYTAEELTEAILYILNNFVNKQRYRGEILDCKYRAKKYDLVYIDDPEEVGDEPGYYYSGRFVKSSPQLRDNESQVFDIEFWTFEYPEFQDLKKFIINNEEIPALVRYRKAVKPQEVEKDDYVDNKEVEFGDEFIDIGLDLDDDDDDSFDLDIDIDEA